MMEKRKTEKENPPIPEDEKVDWQQRALKAERELARYEGAQVILKHTASVLQRIAKEGEKHAARIIEADKKHGGESLVLYKYISGEALKGLLTYGDFKVTYRHDANDPLEMLPAGYLPLEYRNFGIGFMSFTENANDPAMWGNYAEKYKGARVRLEIPYFGEEYFKAEEAKLKPINSNDYSFEALLALTSKLLTRAGADTFFYQFKENGEKLDFSYLFKCLYEDDRYIPEKGAEEASEYADCLSKIAYEHMSDEQRNDFTLCSLALIRESILKIGTKHKTWQQEREYRSLISDDKISRKVVEHSCIFLTQEFSKYVKTITLGPLCPLSETEARILLRDNHAIRNDVQVNRASFNRTSFLLDIPNEYEEGKQVGAQGPPNKDNEQSEKQE